jgi:hypothetical protein
LAKSDLEKHLRKTNGLLSSQFGFRSRRGCSSALGTAHTGWLQAAAREGIVGLLGFDLSSAFDTVNAKLLLPKLERPGIAGRALSWHKSYLTGGRQCVAWNEETSPLVDVMYGVCQGSILGPLLFLVLMANLPMYLGGREDNVIYADDINTWESESTVEEVATRLTDKARMITAYARGNSLTLNASKKQLKYSRGAGTRGVPIMVDSARILPGPTMELLGVTIDRKLTTTPHDTHVAASARQKASLVARLGHHVPQGKFLRQLAMGLFGGKVSHALAAVAAPTLRVEDKENNKIKSVQMAQNDVARTVTGHKRSDRVTLADLLTMAHMQSLNSMVITAVALETWSAFPSSNGMDRARNPLRVAIFGNDNTRETRASKAGHTHIALSGENTLA